MTCPRCGASTFRDRYCASFCGWNNEEDVAPHLVTGWSEIDREEYKQLMGVANVRPASHTFSYEPKPYLGWQCPKCGKRFRARGGHMLYHKNERRR